MSKVNFATTSAKQALQLHKKRDCHSTLCFAMTGII